MRKKKFFSLLLASALVGQALFTGLPALQVKAVDAVEATVKESDLSEKQTTAPAKDNVVPSANQYKYQKDELAGFCHFGMNTYTGSEWGNGQESPDRFTLETFDAESLVKGFHDAGFKKLIVTAKHHDGFCIWKSQYTEHDLESTSYKGDVLEEISKACTKYNMDMGLYLSPWDVNNDSYGYKDAQGNLLLDAQGNPKNGMTWEQVYAADAKDYNKYYDDQLIEILGNPKYGNNGHFVEVWMDGAKGSGSLVQNYDFQKWFATIQKYEGKTDSLYEDDCMLFGAEAYTTVRWIGNENGFAADETWSKSTVDKTNNRINSNQGGGFTKGFANGNQWTVPEADARITSGWFWGASKAAPKSMQALGEMYFRSVGHNAPLLLNVPPNNQGTVDKAILDRLSEFGTAIKDTFADNLAENATISASQVRENALAYSPQKLLDGDDNTYWTVNDNTNTATLIVDLGAKKNFDVVSIEEAIQFGQRISEFKVEYKDGDNPWKEFDHGATIGAKRLCRRYPVNADKLRITVKTSEQAEHREPILSEIGVYKAVKSFEVPKPFPEELVVIDDRDFTKSGANWSNEAGENFIQGTGVWTNGDAEKTKSATVTFTGTKAWVMGTVDPNHGTAEIWIDDQKVKDINTNGTTRKLQQVLYETDTLSNGQHTLKIVPSQVNKAVGLDAVLVMNNGGKGMFDLEQKSYRVDEGKKTEIKVKRVGGSTGAAQVKFEVNPGTAIQKHFDVDGNMTLDFADGQTEATAYVTTYHVQEREEDLTFSIELVNPTNGTFVGFNTPAEVIITDYEDITRDGAYSAEDPFVFPKAGEPARRLEAEHFILNNDTTGDGNWPMVVSSADWASNKKFVNAMGVNDTITLHYTAEQTGEYTAVVTYRSGDAKNGFSWAETNGNITAGNATVGASDSAGATHTQELTFNVEKAGAGTLVITSGANKGPQLDKFEITKKAGENPPAEEVNKTELDALIQTAESKDMNDYVDGDKKTTFLAKLEAAKTVSENEEATQEEVNTAKNELQTAMEALQLKDPNAPGDKTELNDSIEEAKELELDAYEDGEAKEHFLAMLQAAEAVKANANATQAQIDAAMTALEEAKNALEPKENPPAPTVNKDALHAAIAAAEAKELDSYKDGAEKEAFRTALAAAKEVAADTAATQTQVDKAKQDLQTAMDALIPNDPKPAADKEELRRILADAEGINLDGYQDGAAKDAFVAALAAAKNVVNDGNATQEQVDAAGAAVLEAMRALEKKPSVPTVNKDALHAVIAEAEGKVLDNYKDGAQKDAFTAALKAAKAVAADAAATQAQTDAAKDALDKAMKALVVKEKPVKPEQTKPSKPNAAETGDAATVTVWLAFAAVSVCTVAVVRKRRHS